jgi:DNA processing protein
LAGLGAYAWFGFPFVWAIVRGVWVAGGGVSGALATVGALQVTRCGRAGVFKKQAFKRAEKELASIRGIENCRLVSRADPEYPQTLLQIYDPPTPLYVRGDVSVLNQPSISIVGTRRPTL